MKILLDTHAKFTRFFKDIVLSKRNSGELQTAHIASKMRNW
jgi:hypothetical protein